MLLVVNREPVAAQAEDAADLLQSDARGGLRRVNWSGVVVVRCAGDGLVSGADLENHVSRAVWDSVEWLLGAPDIVTFDFHSDRLLVRAVCDRQACQHADLVSMIKQPVITAARLAGWSPSPGLGLNPQPSFDELAT